MFECIADREEILIKGGSVGRDDLLIVFCVYLRDINTVDNLLIWSGRGGLVDNELYIGEGLEDEVAIPLNKLSKYTLHSRQW